MTDVLIQHEIDRLLDEIDGELTTFSRIVDALLDLRLAGESNQLLVIAIDDALANIPGRTAVPNEWWMHQLETFTAQLNPAVEASGPAVVS